MIWVLIGVVALQWVRSKITRLAVRKKEDIWLKFYQILLNCLNPTSKA